MRTEPANIPERYRGYGVCTDCGGPIGRAREDGLTIDRCHDCGAEWECADRDRSERWVKVE